MPCEQMALEVTQDQLNQVQQELASLRCQLEIKSEVSDSLISVNNLVHEKKNGEK